MIVVLLKLFLFSFRPMPPSTPGVRIQFPPETRNIRTRTEFKQQHDRFEIVQKTIPVHLPIASVSGDQLVPGSPEQARAGSHYHSRVPGKPNLSAFCVVCHFIFEQFFVLCVLECFYSFLLL